ncbi:MAG TPA: hypothetical protein VEQ59_22040, partial [Polyangiaceae bacterium]|nr:hypothetical protein [Polyangiaceae bacterium]
GIEPAALAALAEHEFPGNELELFGLISRTAATVSGSRITLKDLQSSGLGEPSLSPPPPPSTSDPAFDPPPSLAARRRALRRAPGR